jgi:hypothetical protein
MALYDTRFGLPQAVVDYLNQGLPSIQQPYRPGYDKNYGPGKGMGYTTVMPQPGYQYVYGPDGQRYSIPIPGYNPNEDADDPYSPLLPLYPEVVMMIEVVNLHPRYILMFRLENHLISKKD